MPYEKKYSSVEAFSHVINFICNYSFYIFYHQYKLFLNNKIEILILKSSSYFQLSILIIGTLCATDVRAYSLSCS